MAFNASVFAKDAMEKPINLPFTNYALIYINYEGKLRVSESSCIHNQQNTLFTPDVCNKFLEMVEPKIGCQKPSFYGAWSSPYGHSEDQVKTDTALDMQTPGCYSSVFQVCPNLTSFQIGHTQMVLEYYTNAFEDLQQRNCRQIAKAFICVVEPKKQSNHPYSGGWLRDPERTKPEWWPAGISHRDPDHLPLKQRIPLLTHIVHEGGRFGITSDKLIEAAYDSRKKLKPIHKIEILYEILKVRQIEEQYERGEIDGATLVYVKSRDANQRRTQDFDEEGGFLDTPLLALQAPISFTPPASSATVGRNTQIRPFDYQTQTPLQLSTISSSAVQYPMDYCNS
ncbi:hypothetical protein PHISCL_08666 [Aspergillus sclerotialis]|uniref:Subtelomeric hrmA-associated cluster protein AFUB-079030/YDR124W-like helical bundle domain-containing protein n=1 Tax=Aspergillus sclerotialis TaxID=2070753 RepID=A0A3A2ZI36_9EURO|nr:hypothetical protein PHISCL_08666 [Aspergillus sclerotialis]